MLGWSVDTFGNIYIMKMIILETNLCNYAPLRLPKC